MKTVHWATTVACVVEPGAALAQINGTGPRDVQRLVEFAAPLYGYWAACLEVYPTQMAPYKALRSRMQVEDDRIARLRIENQSFAERVREYKELVLAEGQDKLPWVGCERAAREHFVPLRRTYARLGTIR